MVAKRKYQYTVTLEVVDPPPDHDLQIRESMEKELRMRFGQSVQVIHMGVTKIRQ